MQDEYLNYPRMILQGSDTMQDGPELARIVLHEFGHAMGLEHELRKSVALIPWDTALYTHTTKAIILGTCPRWMRIYLSAL